MINQLSLLLVIGVRHNSSMIDTGWRQVLHLEPLYHTGFNQSKISLVGFARGNLFFTATNNRNLPQRIIVSNCEDHFIPRIHDVFHRFVKVRGQNVTVAISPSNK